MYSRLHQKLGTAGFIISIIALVAALGGGAYAANSALSGKQKKEVEKIAKKYAGKPGLIGATGPAGNAGLAGAKGEKGETGATGNAGTAGSPGTRGAEGPEGSPWTAGGTLPSGATETGVWGGGEGDAEGRHYDSAQFNVPLQEPIEGTKVVIVKSDEASQPGCPGRGQSTAPEAEPGFFCVYVGPEEGGEVRNLIRLVDGPTEWEYVRGAGASGALIWTECSSTCFLGGTWAVTAE